MKQYLWQTSSFFLHEVVLLELVIGVVLVPGLQEIKPAGAEGGVRGLMEEPRNKRNKCSNCPKEHL